MLCSNMATRRDGFQFPCGQCLNCKINKRRAWQARLLLEAASHEYNCFVTLTFAPVGNVPVLRRAYSQDFVAALCEAFPGTRYFGVGEYGSLYGRAHYHVHIFSKIPISQYDLSKIWPFGSVDVGSTEPASLDYALGYLLKDRREDLPSIQTRFPEYRFHSQGIGKLALNHLLIDSHTLPREFKVFGRTWPIPRYLRERARKMGLEISDRKEVILQKLETQEMRALLSNPNMDAEQKKTLYDEYWKKQEDKRKLIRDKAVRDYYREKHHHSLKRHKHETLKI